MAEIDVPIGGRNYELACRDGDEDRLRALAMMVDRKTIELARSMGGVTEVRQLLFASLLLADDLAEEMARSAELAKAAAAAPPPPVAEGLDDDAAAQLIEQLAARVEALAARLEKNLPNT